LCPICKWDCLPIDLRRERDLHQHHHPQVQQEQQSPPNNSFVVDMTVPSPPAHVLSSVDYHTTAEPRNTTDNIIPPSPHSSNQYNENPFDMTSSSTRNSPTVLNEKRNPFEGSRTSETDEGPTTPIANVPAFSAASLSPGPTSVNEKESSSKDH
jgi:hypothetical protein